MRIQEIKHLYKKYAFLDHWNKIEYHFFYCNFKQDKLNLQFNSFMVLN